MIELWKNYLQELKSPPLIGPGTREGLPVPFRFWLHYLFITFRYAGFYMLLKPIGWLIIILSMKLKISGMENIPREDKGRIQISNHLSNFDPMVGIILMPRPMYAMTKIEYFKTPVLGGIATALGGFPVKRGEPDRQAIKTALAILKSGGTLGIYPEGTRSKTYTLQPGHPGAALLAVSSGVSIVPYAIWGSENVVRRRKSNPFKRPVVNFTVGKPFELKKEGEAFAAAHNLAVSSKRSRHNELEYLSDIMLLKVAELLPPQYQGEFTPQGIIFRYTSRA